MAPRKSPEAVHLGRRGGKARLKKMTAEQRREVAQKAAQSRWGKKGESMTHEEWLQSHEAAIARHDRWLAEHEAAVKRHDEEMAEHRQEMVEFRKQMVELRNLVGEVGQMLGNFIASMTGRTKNGKAE